MSTWSTDGRDEPSTSSPTNMDIRGPMSGGRRAATEMVLPTISAQGTPTPPETGPARQLSSLDVRMHDAESTTNPLHIAAVTILQPETTPLNLTALRQLIAARMPLIAPLRRRLRTVPLGLDLPYWQDCSSIDLDHHVQPITLMPGIGEEQFADLIAQLHAVPLDRSGPLWTCHLISGLPEGRQALVHQDPSRGHRRRVRRRNHGSLLRCHPRPSRYPDP